MFISYRSLQCSFACCNGAVVPSCFSEIPIFIYHYVYRFVPFLFLHHLKKLIFLDVHYSLRYNSKYSSSAFIRMI
jgi:hypothetical protein